MKWTDEKIKELVVLVNSFKRIDEISKIMGMTKSSIQNKMFRLNIKTIFIEEKHCKECGKIFDNYISQNKIFCSSSCAAIFNNKLKEVVSDETKQKISDSVRYWHKNNPKVKKIKVNKLIKCKYCGKDCNKPYKRICEDCKNKYYNFYRPDCEFIFNIKNFPDEFELTLISKNGWYSPTNKFNNLNGISRDHMYSVKEGFINKISPEIIRHPANCKLMVHHENNVKKSNSSITIDELLKKIILWDTKYPDFINKY